MKKVAIVGGGPGGLFAARNLSETCGDLCTVTIFEALDRLGGKIMSRTFRSAPVTYEAGVAEFYDYSQLGEDPIRELIEKLGLKTVPLEGSTIIIGDHILNTDADIRRKLGVPAAAALDAFHDRCEAQYSTDEYYENYWRDDNTHPLVNKNFAEILNEIPDELARRYVATAVHTDVAAEPHLTTAINGIKNVLMDNDDYMRLYAVVGGNQRLIDRLVETNSAEVVLEAPVLKVGKTADQRYRVTFRRHGRIEHEDFDFVIMALPNYWLPGIDFEGRRLRKAIESHVAHYDKPAHYLRVNALFREPFWRKTINGYYFMQDVFGGACLYDEGARYPGLSLGSLGWLIAGTEALALSNLKDDEIIRRVVDSLPGPLAHGRELLIEAHVQRWVATVNAVPGGNPMHELSRRHQPEPIEHPGLLVMGDYLFNSTVNATFNSADYTTSIVMTELRRARFSSPGRDLAFLKGADGLRGAGRQGERAAETGGEAPRAEVFSARHAAGLINAVWGKKGRYKLLDVGSASGARLALFEELGLEAWGIENAPHLQARTAPKWKHRNLLGDIRALPFEDYAFDFVFDTHLCYVPEEDLDAAVSELFRVARKGVCFGSIISDMNADAIARHDLFRGVRSLKTAWQWSELFMKHGFRMAITDPKVMKKVWDIECKTRGAGVPWYREADTIRSCFFTKPEPAKDVRRPLDLVRPGHSVIRIPSQPQLILADAASDVEGR